MLPTAALYLVALALLAFSFLTFTRADAYTKAERQSAATAERIKYRLKVSLYDSLVGPLALASLVTLGFAIWSTFS